MPIFFVPRHEKTGEIELQETIRGINGLPVWEYRGREKRKEKKGEKLVIVFP